MEEYFEEIAAVAGEIDDAVEDEEGAVCRLPYIVRQRQDSMQFYDDGELSLSRSFACLNAQWLMS